MQSYHKPRLRSPFGFGFFRRKLLYVVSVFASLGVFLFGYDQGVMSGIITGPFFKTYFNNPSALEIGTMVAILEIGAFITSLASGRVGDIIGRRKTLLCGAIIFTLGGFVQTCSVGFWSMVTGRFVSGFGVGLLSSIVPIYQSEISPPNHRGALACVEFTGNIVGYAFSVWVDYFCSFIESNLSWRLPLFVQCIIGAILALGSLVIPGSPRWLLDNDKDEEGLRVLLALHGHSDEEHHQHHQSHSRHPSHGHNHEDADDDDEDGDEEDLAHDLNHTVQEEFREIKERVLFDRQQGEGRSYSVMYKKYRKRVLLAMSSQAFAQLNGINVISYYAPRVFEEAGWVGRQAILMTGINSLFYIASTIPPWYLVDRWGRRPILLSGAILMAIALFATGYFMYLEASWTPNAVVMSVIFFNAAFGYSWGPIPWLYPPEIMPLPFRAKGVSLSTATNWAFNWIVGEATPVLQELIEYRLYWMHAGFCLCSFVVVILFYPETKGIALEDMDLIFNEGHPPGHTHHILRTSEDITLQSHSVEVHSGSETTSYPPHVGHRHSSQYHLGEDDDEDESRQGLLSKQDAEVDYGGRGTHSV